MIKYTKSTSTAVTVVLVLLFLLASALAVVGGTWLVCYFWDIQFTWRIAAGAFVIWCALPRSIHK